jgi:hypothetical protein
MATVRVLSVLIALTLSSCATSYKPDGFSGGYTDRQVGKNKFMVTFRGNGYTRGTTVEEYAHQRANEVCAERGHDGYELIQQGEDKETTSGPSQINCSKGYGGNVACTNSPGLTITKNTVTLYFSCYSDGKNNAH